MGELGSSAFPYTYYEDVYVTEAEKNGVSYLKGNIDHWIASLIRSKPHIHTYRNYYSGIRDNKEFSYLTDNFGIGTPSTLKFTNLIKTRIDSLVDQVESDTHTFAVSCLDNKTIDSIKETKKNNKLKTIMSSIEGFTQTIDQAMKNGDKMPTLSELKSNINNISKKFNQNFLSEYEVAAQRVLVYFEKSNEMDIRRKLSTLAHDLMVTGEAYYRVYFERIGADPILEVIKPENFFHNKNTNNSYIDGTDAVVHREYMTHKEVVMKYGKYLSKDELKQLFGNTFLGKTARSLNSGLDLEIYYSEDDPMLGQKHHSAAYTVEVMHVEWLATNYVDLTDEERDNETTIESGKFYEPKKSIPRVDRYEGTRIGGRYYVNCGKSLNITRSQNDPYNCKLSYGGVINNDRGGDPYSVVGALKDIQDIYDLSIFYRDNLLANSGVPGDRINVAAIPKVLGGDFMERLFKFIALKKNGMELIDPTEPGAQLFQHYGNFDNSVNGNSLMAIESLLRSIEHQADVIAGTNPQILGDIKERDAVSNVETGINRSLAINQVTFGLFRDSHTKIMSALLNTAQISYKEGKKISYVAGSESYIFDIMPEHFSHTDFGVAISYGSKDSQKLIAMRALAKELITAGMVDPDVMIKILLSDSVTEVSKLITENWALKKAENDQLGQATKNAEQLEKSNKELEGELNNIKQQLEASRTNDINTKRQEALAKAQTDARKLDLEERKIIGTEEFNDKQIELKEKVVQLEREQLYMATGAAKEVKNL